MSSHRQTTHIAVIFSFLTLAPLWSACTVYILSAQSSTMYVSMGSHWQTTHTHIHIHIHILQPHTADDTHYWHLRGGHLYPRKSCQWDIKEPQCCTNKKHTHSVDDPNNNTFLPPLSNTWNQSQLQKSRQFPLTPTSFRVLSTMFVSMSSQWQTTNIAAI